MIGGLFHLVFIRGKIATFPEMEDAMFLKLADVLQPLTVKWETTFIPFTQKVQKAVNDYKN
jgi:hypothetical protein